MERVLNFARLVCDVSWRRVEGVNAKNNVIEFLNSLGSPTEEELSLFDDIIRKQDFSVFTRNIEDAPWCATIQKSDAPDDYVLRVFIYHILSKEFYGNDYSKMNCLLSDIYSEDEDNGFGSEFERIDATVCDWVKAIVNRVFPFLKCIFTHDSYNSLSTKERGKLDVFMNLTRFAYVEDYLCDDDIRLIINILSNPENPHYKEYNKERLQEFVKIAKDGDYRKLINSFGDMHSEENVISKWAIISDSYGLSKEERENLWKFAYGLWEMFENKDDNPFDSFANKMKC